MCISAEQRFSIAADLVYPAALGAGIAWWFEGLIGWRARENPSALAIWALTFGLFFIAYHSRNFLVLRDEYGGIAPDGRPRNSRYHTTTFARDAVDCFALVAGFMCLRFPGGKMRFADPVGVYLIALLIPLSALVTDWRKGEPASWRWRAFALLPPSVGLLNAWYVGGDRFEPNGIDAIVLTALVALLLVYLINPGIYGVRKLTMVPDADLDGPERSIRVGLDILLSLLVLLIVASRVRFEPGERTLERWIYVGKIDHFVTSRPCRTDSELEQQVKRLDSMLAETHPARIKLVGSADAIPLTPVAREFVGNNAGLAHFRAECIQRWLVTTDHYAGVEFQMDDDVPRLLSDADPVDRAVLVWVVQKDVATTGSAHR